LEVTQIIYYFTELKSIGRYMMKTKKAGLIALIAFTIVAILHLFSFEISPLPSQLLFASRWILVALLLVFAFFKKSLTTWILVSIFLGVVVGSDFPGVALSFQPLSQGFIKLIKTIVGPILFATLVYGIAGHSDLKQVGRMAWKSLLYFYSATTIALFIGLAAINVSKAGVGIDASKIPHHDLPKTSAVKDADVAALKNIPEGNQWIYKTTAFFRDIFPENIIKSVYENQVLQIVIFAVIFGIGLAKFAESKKKPIVDFMDSLSETMFKYNNQIMNYALLV